jgi:hypothetical protein
MMPKPISKGVTKSSGTCPVRLPGTQQEGPHPQHGKARKHREQSSQSLYIDHIRALGFFDTSELNKGCNLNLEVDGSDLPYATISGL